MHLESTLAEICRERWSKYLTVVPKDCVIHYNGHLGNQKINLEKLINDFGSFRPKEHFSWDFAPLPYDAKPMYVLANAKKQYHFYSELLKEARIITAELNKPNPNYQSIIDRATRIKNSSTTVPSIIDGARITLNVGWSLGGNLVIDFITGLFGLIHAPIMALVGVLYAIPYCLSFSQYCGSPEFFLDTAVYFCNSAFQVLSSIFYPLGMLYSKYTTDSYDIVTKGKVERAVEGIISLAKEKLVVCEEQVDTGLSLLDMID